MQTESALLTYFARPDMVGRPLADSDETAGPKSVNLREAIDQCRAVLSQRELPLSQKLEALRVFASCEVREEQIPAKMRFLVKISKRHLGNDWRVFSSAYIMSAVEKHWADGRCPW
jgi:hypothetical protein